MKICSLRECLSWGNCTGQWCWWISFLALLHRLLRSGHLPFVASFLIGWRPLPSHSCSCSPFCILSEALPQSIALQHHTWQTLLSSSFLPHPESSHPASPALASLTHLLKSCSVSGSPPRYLDDSRSQQFPAHPFLRSLQGRVTGAFPSLHRDPRDLSSPAPGLCYSLIWCSCDACYGLIWCSLPWHGDSRQPGGDGSLCPGSFSLWPCSPPVSWLQVNFALCATASKQGASQRGEQRPGGILLSFFPPHP